MSRASILLSVVNKQDALNQLGIPKDIQNLEKNLRIDMAFYESKIEEERMRKRKREY